MMNCPKCGERVECVYKRNLELCVFECEACDYQEADAVVFDDRERFKTIIAKQQPLVDAATEWATSCDGILECGRTMDLALLRECEATHRNAGVTIRQFVRDAKDKESEQ